MESSSSDSCTENDPDVQFYYLSSNCSKTNSQMHTEKINHENGSRSLLNSNNSRSNYNQSCCCSCSTCLII